MEGKKQFGLMAKTTSSLSPASVPVFMSNAASDDDEVWDQFLPSNYLDILARAVTPVHCATKKDAYVLLCHSPVLLDDGNMSFMLNKVRGEKCYMLSARELSMAWKESPYFWRWTSLPQSRFPEVADLQGVCWLEIHGKMSISMLSKNTTYVVYLVFKTKDNCFGLEYALEAVVKIARKEGEMSLVHLLQPNSTTAFQGDYNRGCVGRLKLQQNARRPWKRDDGLMEVLLGEFFNDHGDVNGEVEASVMEIKAKNWKGGLVVEGMEFRPKGM